MSDETVKVNFAIKRSTVAGLNKLSEQTFRGKSDVIDWLVAEKVAQVEFKSEQPQPEPAKVN